MHIVGPLEGVAPRLQPSLKDLEFAWVPHEFRFAALKGDVVQLGKVQLRRCGCCWWALEIPLEQMQPATGVKLVVQGELQNGCSPPSRPYRPQPSKVCDTPRYSVPQVAQRLLKIA